MEEAYGMQSARPTNKLVRCAVVLLLLAAISLGVAVYLNHHAEPTQQTVPVVKQPTSSTNSDEKNLIRPKGHPMARLTLAPFCFAY